MFGVDCDVLAANGINGICVKSNVNIGCLSGVADNFVVVTGTKFADMVVELLFEPNEAGVDSILANFGVGFINVVSGVVIDGTADAVALSSVRIAIE